MNRNRLGMKYVFRIKYLSFALLSNELITSFRNWCHLIIVHFDYLQLLRPNLKSFLTKWKDWKRGRIKGRYSETLSRKYTNRDVCCESNALL